MALSRKVKAAASDELTEIKKILVTMENKMEAYQEQLNSVNVELKTLSKKLLSEQKKQMMIISENCNSLIDTKYESIHNIAYLNKPNLISSFSKEDVIVKIETLFTDKLIAKAIENKMKELGSLR